MQVHLLFAPHTPVNILTPMGIGARIYRAALNSGLGGKGMEARIADIAGVKRANVYNWKKDTAQSIDAAIALRLCQAFNVRVEWLVNDEGAMTPEQQALVPSEIDKLWAAVPKQLKPHFYAPLRKRSAP